ncbi:YcjF family protein [Magnetococcales bacterium HHB-1]
MSEPSTEEKGTVHDSEEAFKDDLIEEPTVGDLIHAEAESIVKDGVIAAMAVGVIPIPLLDIAGIMGISMKMLERLSNLFEIPFSDTVVKEAMISFASGLLPVAAMTGMASLIKSIPGPGSIGGAGAVSVLSGAMVYALGQVFIQHFEDGGTMEDFDVHAVQDQFRNAFEKGKRLVQKQKKSSL